MTDISSQIGVSTHSSKTNNEMWESIEEGIQSTFVKQIIGE